MQLFDVAVADVAPGLVAFPDQAGIPSLGEFLRGVDERRVPAPAIDASSKSRGAPPFAVIAAKEKINSEMIASFLLLPHATMPNSPLTHNDAEDIAAFIMGMKK